MTVKEEYGIRKMVDATYTATVDRTIEALKAEGFGVISEIDMREKLHEKLGVSFGPYVILGACNPALAHRALQAEPEIGLLLPCNVIVYALDDAHAMVSAIDPDTMLSVIGDNAAVREIAADARVRLQRAIAAV